MMEDPSMWKSGMAAALTMAFAAIVAACAENSNEQPAEAPLTPLAIELPEPFFGGTPYDGPHIFDPDEEIPRPPFLVPEGTVLLSRGKPVSSNVLTPRSGTLSQITDGIKKADAENRVDLGRCVPWIQIDLGAEHQLAAIMMWRSWKGGDVYLNVIVQISNDPFFKEGVTTLFNNDREDELHLGAGQDYNYFERHDGKLIDAKGVTARYIRSYTSGSIYGGINNLVEVEVWGRTVE